MFKQNWKAVGAHTPDQRLGIFCFTRRIDDSIHKIVDGNNLCMTQSQMLLNLMQNSDASQDALELLLLLLR